jgi:hypothetical protein
LFKIYDGRDKFYQWDLDRALIVEDPSITEVHFCNRTDSCSLICETFEEDGLTLVAVPNILLTTDWKIHVYAYDGKHTKHEECYEVISRTKPADYIYTETEVKNYEQFVNDLEALKVDVEEIKENGVGSKINIVNSYGKSSIAQTPEKDYYTIANPHLNLSELDYTNLPDNIKFELEYDDKNNVVGVRGVKVGAFGDFSTILGSKSQATGKRSVAEGSGCIAAGKDSHAEGCDTIAYGTEAHAEGWGTIAIGSQSHAEGTSTVANGKYSHAEGDGTLAEGYAAHSEGYLTEAVGKTSHAEGNNTIANGSHSHAEGYFSQALGEVSHAEGHTTHANSDYSHTEGVETQANGKGAHAEGHYTQANGEYSHAEGETTKAIGNYSHAEGFQSQATANYSHAQNYHTIASGYASNATGWETEASGNASTALGKGTVAKGQYSLARGRYNVIDDAGDYVDIVGNGDVLEDGTIWRNNCYTLDWYGRGWFKRTVEAPDGFILKSPNGTRYQIKVDNSGNLSTTKLV